MHLVFSYGSLADHFPKSVVSTEALFIGDYILDDTNIFVSLIPSTKSQAIPGVLLELSDDDFAKADKFESELFHREERTILTPELDEVTAWVYFETDRQRPVSYRDIIDPI